MKRRLSTLTLIAVLLLTLAGTATAANPNPGVIPNQGPKYAQLAEAWWQWAYSFPTMAEYPYFNTGGAVDISAGQSGHIWFLAGSPGGGPVVRTGTIPTGTSLFFPIANLLNDYPCPDPTFQPDPGESLEHFLQRTGYLYLDYYVGNPPSLFAEIDGEPLMDLAVYQATSSLFMFTADPALAPNYDPCVTGSPQPGVTLGYWLLLPPLTPGQHTLHFGSAGPISQDITYQLTVTPGR